ncbi:MAG: hypothetical protein ACHQUC_10195 [Chlamydiales bacterium]
MSTIIFSSRLRESSGQLSKNVLDPNGPVSRTGTLDPFFPALIAAIGSLLGLSISVALGSSSKVFSVIGIASIAVGTELGATLNCSQGEKIHPFAGMARDYKQESTEIAAKVVDLLLGVSRQLNSFISSLDSEQLETLFSVIDQLDIYAACLLNHEFSSIEDQNTQSKQWIDSLKTKRFEELTSSFAASKTVEEEEISSAFVLTQKQKELLKAVTSVFSCAKGETKGLEILCKFFSAEKKGQLNGLARVLHLTSEQKQLFKDFTKTLKEEAMNEEIIYSAIQCIQQAKLSSKIHSCFRKEFRAQEILLFPIPLYSLLEIMKPVRFLEIVKPLGVLWTFIQLGSLFAGALAAGYILYHCFYSNSQAEIRSQAIQLQAMNLA